MEDDFDFARATRRVLFRSVNTQEIPGAGRSAAAVPQRHVRVKVTMNLDGDVVRHFKERAIEVGQPYQTLINQVLREYIEGTRPEQLAGQIAEILVERRSFLDAVAAKIAEPPVPAHRRMSSVAAVDYVIFSDGGGDRSSTAAGACIVQSEHDSARRKVVAVLGPGTNNEGELVAALAGFSFAQLVSESSSRSAHRLHWVCDSEYVLKSATGYIKAWQRNGWRTADKKPVKNQGLWRAYLTLSARFSITAEHVRGHTGHPENEECDAASTWARKYGLEALASRGEGYCLTDGDIDPEWYLLDARPFISACREEEPRAEVFDLLKRGLEGATAEPEKGAPSKRKMPAVDEIAQLLDQLRQIDQRARRIESERAQRLAALTQKVLRAMEA